MLAAAVEKFDERKMRIKISGWIQLERNSNTQKLQSIW